MTTQGGFDIDSQVGHRALTLLTDMALQGAHRTTLPPGIHVPRVPPELLPPNHQQQMNDRRQQQDDVGTFAAFLRHQLLTVALIIPTQRNGNGGYDLAAKPTPMSKFLNRLLGLPVQVQQLVFEFYWCVCVKGCMYVKGCMCIWYWQFCVEGCMCK